MKTQIEIDAIKLALARQRDSLPNYSAFGNNNWERIDGQLEVLNFELTDEDAVYARYGGDASAEDYDPVEDEIANDIRMALDWLNGDLPDNELVDDEHLEQKANG